LAFNPGIGRSRLFGVDPFQLRRDLYKRGPQGKHLVGIEGCGSGLSVCHRTQGAAKALPMLIEQVAKMRHQDLLVDRTRAVIL
jgi:hypothetical protein